MTAKWSAFPAGSAVGATDSVPGLQSGANVLWAWSQAKTYITGGGTLAIASGKTFSVSNTLTLAGTDSTTMTFPATSATVAGLGIAQTFTAQNTFAAGTLATSQPFTVSQTLNAGAVNFVTLLIDNTYTSDAGSSIFAQFKAGGTEKFRVDKNGAVQAQGNIVAANSSLQATGGGHVYVLSNTGGVFWGSSADIQVYREAAGVLQLRGSGATSPAAMSFYTYAASPPAAPAASIARLYADTSGGKIRLMALFPSGAAQQIAIEP